MKYFKLAVLAFVVCFGTYAFGAKADGYMSFLNISIPKASKNYESVQLTKDINNPQYYKNQRTDKVAVIGSASVIVKTKSLNGSVSSGIQVGSGQQLSWGENIHAFEGKYKVRISSAATLVGTQHWGMWILDERLA